VLCVRLETTDDLAARRTALVPRAAPRVTVRRPAGAGDLGRRQGGEDPHRAQLGAQDVGDHPDPALGVLGLEQRLSLGEREGRESGERPGEVRRVAGKVTARRFAVDLEQGLAVRVVRRPGGQAHRFGNG
jgi:hypothetical protein